MERLGVSEKLNDLYSKIKESYARQLSSLKLILIIMKFLFENYKNNNFVFIFDQFKEKYIEDGFNNVIFGYTNIKIVLCSSINDKDIRKECIKTWKDNKINITDFNENIQKYYIYYNDIYTFKQKKYNSKLLNQFNYLPKYIKIYEDNEKNETAFLKVVKSKIETKIKEFCENDESNYYDLLIHLRYIIGNEYNFNDFSEVIVFCLLKFFKIIINQSTFRIKPIFSYMYNFIMLQFNEDICLNYFKKHLYRNNTIENDSVKGCYFEEAVKFGLQRLELPCKIDKIITLREISEMEEIIDLNSYYNIDDEGNEGNEDGKENKVDSCEIDENKENLMDIISKEDDNNNENTIKFKKLLKNYNIDDNLIKSNILNNKKYISNNSLKYSKNIEYFRLDEIENRNKNDKVLLNDNFEGGETLFLNQIKKTGKTLDCALLYGEKYKKVFIGFQIKCYFNNSILKEESINKFKIRENCKKILVNSMVLFNCKIIDWKYILIFYINDEVKEENINIKNLESCQSNNISYIFYDPKKTVFKNENKNKISKLELNDFSDLDYCKLNVSYYSDIDKIIRDKGEIQIAGNIEDMINSFIKDMTFVKKVKKNRLAEILDNISHNIGFKLKFAAKINIIEDGLLLPPNNKHVYIYKISINSKVSFILIHKNQKKNVYINFTIIFRLGYFFPKRRNFGKIYFFF